MSASRASGLLRLYPPVWRERYGQELEDLIVEASGGGPVPWRMRADVMLGAARERLRAAGLTGDGAPGDRARGGALLVLCAWALFVVAGLAVQKASEHWQDAVPAPQRALPSAAFDVLVVVAVIASLLVLAGIAAALPRLSALVHDGGWPAIRPKIVTAGLFTIVALSATAGLVIWAHGLTPRRRAGHDLAYAIAFAAWAALVVAALVAWTVAAVAAARRLRLRPATLRLEAWAACAVTAGMGVMTAATALWWAAVAGRAPWFLAGTPAGSAESPLAPQLVAAAALMLIATLLGVAGSRQALRALPALSEQRSG